MLRKQIIQVDFCVVGGGLAGMCAAIAAARKGLSVVLMHERPVLGGNASSEIRMWVCGAHGENNRETGIIEEIALENYRRNPTKNFYLWDTVLYDFILREKNIRLLLNCTCMDADVQEGDFPHGRSIRIESVTGYQMTTQTFFEIHSTYYADCSGDSILAPLTGASYREGREGRDDYGEPTHVEVHDQLHMGMSCLLQGRETTQPVTFTPPAWSTKLTPENFTNRNLDLRNSYTNYWYLELGGDRDAIEATEDVARELIPLALGTWDLIKNSSEHQADTWELDFLGFLPGKRESRRMVGEYTITANDILNNTPFSDVVAYGGWPIDDHYPAGFYHQGQPNTNILPEAPYSIPYRSLYSSNVSNLFFAGRNISMTHMAMSSIRVMATCALLGQAVGTAAWLCAKHAAAPHDIYVAHMQELQGALMDADCYLPRHSRVIGEICLATPITCANRQILPGQDALKDGQDRPASGCEAARCGCSCPNQIPLTYRFTAPISVESVHVTFNSDLNRTTLPGDICERTHSTRANVRLDSPVMYVPLTLCRSFRLEADTSDGVMVLLDVADNVNRAHHVPVHRTDILALRLIPLSNWGGTENTDVFSFDFR